MAGYSVLWNIKIKLFHIFSLDVFENIEQFFVNVSMDGTQISLGLGLGL